MAEPRSLEDLRGRRVLVLGLGRSGIALARAAGRAGAHVTVYDRRSADELTDAVSALGGLPVDQALGVSIDRARSLIRSTDLLLTSPSVSPRFPTTETWLRDELAAAQERGTPLISEVDLFLRLTRARVLGVTGTKGKTTTAALIGSILEAAALPHVVGGNIGVPLVELAERLAPTDWAVVELSELQLPTISRGAGIAVYTNILEDHLDRHGSVDAYRAVKARLAELSPPDGAVVLNHDDPVSVELGARVAPRTAVSWYGLARPARGTGREAWVDGGSLALDGTAVLAVREIPLPGEHMLRDALAASLAASLAGASNDAIAAGIRAFRGVPHRLEPIATVDGVRYVNDSQATIPAAAIAGLRSFDAPLVLIAGGKDKGLDYQVLADEIVERCRGVVLIGETADALEAAIGGRRPTERAASMAEAVERASRLARSGDVVLLAPAAASFDMFDDYAARGDAFRAAVAALGGPS